MTDLARGLQLTNNIAQLGRFLELQVSGGQLHLGREVADEAGDFFFGDFFEVAAGSLGFLGDDGAQALVDFFVDAGWGNVVLGVVVFLNFAPSRGLLQGRLHTTRNAVGVHYNVALLVAGSAATGLIHPFLTAKKPFLVGTENGTKLTSGKSKPSRNRLIPISTSYT